MEKCSIDHSDYKNNGLITKIWGGPSWIFNHSVTFGYPLNPTEEQKKKYKNYFVSLADVLPCRYCRESYQKFITSGDTALTDEVMQNRETLTKWLWTVHNAVNNKLGIDYGITYEEMVDRYESFRARCGKPKQTNKGCIIPLDMKAFPFKKLYYVDAPIVALEIAEPFVKLAKLRDFDDEYFLFFELASRLQGNFKLLKNLEDLWIYRNKCCQNQIRLMRENGISSIEDDGIWKGTPTIDELKLLLLLSSNLNKIELNEAIKYLETNQYKKLIN